MNIIWLDSIDSTNSEAFRRLADLPGGTVLSAREQTSGRGQRGNSWFAESGRNLTFSIVVKFGAGGVPQLPARDAMWLNYLISDVVARFLRSLGADCTVKWPNDVYVRGKKICGILIENTLKGEMLDAAVIGVGINVNQREFPQLANATSLSCCTERDYDLDACLEKVCALFEEAFSRIFSEEGRRALFQDYSDRLFRKGVVSRFHDLVEDREYWGVIRGVGADGRLCIQDQDAPGKPDRYYRFKEVGYVL